MTFLIGNRYIYSFVEGTIRDTEQKGRLQILGKNNNKTLIMMVRNPNQTVSRNEILDCVWTNNDISVTNASVTQAVSVLRKAFDDDRNKPKYILTVPKCGYRFIASVESIAPIAKESKPTTLNQMLQEESVTYSVVFFEHTKSWLNKIRDVFSIL